MKQKILAYFFLLAAVISILDGALALNTEMELVARAVLLLSGIIVGLAVQEHQKEILQGATAALVAGFFLFEVVGLNYVLFSSVIGMVSTFLIFLATLTLTLGLSYALDYLSHHLHIHSKEAHTSKFSFDYIWAVSILIAVALTFLILLLELFTLNTEMLQVLLVLDALITAVFIADLFFLYGESKNFKDFVTHNFFDILASIPLVGSLRLLKLFRAVRILRATKGSLRLIKLSRVQRTTKFFSKKSSFNKVK